MVLYYFWREFKELCENPLDFVIGVIFSFLCLIVDFIFFPIEIIGLLIYIIYYNL